jgi:regulator of cell morphogenesis and NO signaling
LTLAAGKSGGIPSEDLAMNPNDIPLTVGQLVAERPSRSRVFERYGIDFCCGGKKPLALACAEKGLDPAAVLRSLLADDRDTAHDEFRAAEASVGELIDHVVAAHHVYQKLELPRLHALAVKVAARHGAAHPELVTLRDTVIEFRYEVETHLWREEYEIFPALRRAGQARGGAAQLECAVEGLEHDHDDAGRALARMRELTGGYAPPAGACNSYRALFAGLADLEADMHLHVHEENNILFPRVRGHAAVR